MKLNELVPAKGSRRKKIRRGRGDASGKGNYSGRGMNGQNSRSGGGVRVGFEGGQNPLLRRLPKLKGFKNPNRVEYFPVNFSVLEEKYEDGELVSVRTLLEKGILRSAKYPVKVLAAGSLSKKLSFEGVSFSKSAEKIVGK
jgi:large subunit ribosomal protein L15